MSPGRTLKLMVGLGGLEAPTSPLSELRSLVPREEFTHGAFFCRSRHLLQGTILERSRTENPIKSAALANRWSPQTKLLLDGRRSHQVKDAASCRLSAARKERLSNNCVAKSRTWSSGRISRPPTAQQTQASHCPLFAEIG